MTDKAIIHESELDFIARCTLDYGDIETGGDYFGFWNKDGIPVIQFVTGPGERTSRTSTSFYQDIPYLHRCGEFLHRKYALEHIGSWHSHHRLSLDCPSNGDVSTMRNSLNTQNIDRFFITISNIIQSDTVKIGGFLFSKSLHNLYKETKWIVLPDVSPIRAEIENKSLFFTSPITRNARYKIAQTDLYSNRTIIISEKVELSPNSYFETEKGRKFLKNEFERIKDHKEFRDVELVQNEDKTIGIIFRDSEHDYQIIYPLDFSDQNPTPISLIDGKEFPADDKKDLHSKSDNPVKRIFFGIIGNNNKEGNQTIQITIE